MSPNLKPIKLYMNTTGPNPVKVAIILEELGLPYEPILVKNAKADWYTKINPNGRLPTIIDPNNDGLTLWESGAIVEYLVETYDKENRLNVTDPADKWHVKQYLHFQVSGQGPYFGQAVWFHLDHPEDLLSVKARYEEQVIRVVGVLDKILDGKEYLVAGKATYADLVWIPWNRLVRENKMFEWDEKYELQEKKYPNFFAWHERLISRPALKKALTLGSRLYTIDIAS
ncbi:hypothetical protein FDECE_11393 [Fusarium decemcellulare]|nr:hypothetical protein FDECE_11393 [Fusarium decemcellulare]